MTMEEALNAPTLPASFPAAAAGAGRSTPTRASGGGGEVPDQFDVSLLSLLLLAPPPSPLDLLLEQYDRVMISYCWADQDVVLSVADELERRGFTVWLDRSNMGTELNESIIRGILDSRVVIPFISRHYVESHVCKQEVKFANQNRKPFLPVRLENTPHVESSVAAFVTAGQIYIDLTRGIWENEKAKSDALWRLKQLLTQLLHPASSTDRSSLEHVAAAAEAAAIDSLRPGEQSSQPKPVDLVVKQLTKKGSSGDPAAQYMLALRHQFGVGTPRNLQHASFWILSAANNKQAIYYAALHYAVMLALGEGFPPNVADADAVDLSGDAGDKIRSELDACREVDPAASRVLRGCASWMQSRAEDGCAHAQYAFAEFLGVEMDYTEAVRWHRKAAEQGHAWGQKDLGHRYSRGEGVEQDFAEAARWYRKAAEQGNAVAQNSLGSLHYGGQGVERDLNEAVRWFRKAAEQGNALGQRNLAECYLEGKGVAKDAAEAAKWYKKAAEQGNVSAQNLLGFMHNYGEGVAKDLTEAVRWYRKAAEQGYVWSQANLGLLYLNGEGVAKDVSEARKWLGKAAEQGNEDAKKTLQILNKGWLLW
ncbi:hypothetical protein DFJ73DRAFT_433325 [Zopfochytrium polystomum]|nr:hypothetical protein DFJ73DRAFT_433325 [Zopfochytrium polystomum]